MSDYATFTTRCVNFGLDLRDVNDTVGTGRWVRLNNVTSTQEGYLTLRDGSVSFVEVFAGGPPHSVRRLTPDALVIGAGNGLLYSSGSGSTFYQDPTTLAIFLGFSGDPLTMVAFKAPDSDDPWMFIGDSAAAKKAAADGRLYQWGGEPPAVTAVAVAGGAGLLNSNVAGATTYRWKYLYHSTTTGARTNGSPEMPVGVSLTNQQANVTVQGSTDPQFDQIELYRNGGVNGADPYRLVGTASNAAGPIVIVDNVPDATAALAEPLLTTRFRPFQSALGGAQVTVPLPYIWPFQNFILGVGDPNRPGYLYWTNPGEPDSADVNNNVQVTPQSEPLIAGFTYEKQPFTFSRDNLYAIEYGVGLTTFRGVQTACGRGLSTPWAYSASGPLIYFLSGDGIYVTDGQSPAVSITEDSIRPIFNGLSASNFLPIDFDEEESLRLWWAGQNLYFTYKATDGTQRGLKWKAASGDQIPPRWESYDQPALTLSPGVVYEDENQTQQRVLTTVGGAGLSVITPTVNTDSNIQIVANARTGAIDAGKPQTLKEYGNLIVDADPQGGTITVTPLYDAETVTGPSTALTGSGRQKFPISLADTYAYSLSVDFAFATPPSSAPTAKPIIYQFETLLHLDEERISHWEYPATSHGLAGWQQLKDGYIALNSTGTVRLTVQIDDGDGVDGSTETYDLPSTGSERLKLYVKFRPRKGKVFRYSLDGIDGATFLLYGEDCELHLKPWKTNEGYALISPFRGEA